jgi:hypothetical protein
MMGAKCVLYVNTATGDGAYGSPTWTPVSLARDVEINDDRAEADDSDRSEDQESIDTAQRKIAFTAELKYKPGNAALAALRAAYEANEPIDLFFADAPGGAGAVGKRGDFKLSKCGRKEGLREAVVISLAGGRSNINGHLYGAYTHPA